MARLPQPGGDSGNWGDILNDYLSQSHKPDGTIKDDVVTAAAIADGVIAEQLLSAGVQSKLNTSSPNATSTTLGVVQLAGDLGGSASNPTVPALSNKLDTSTATNTYAKLHPDAYFDATTSPNGTPTALTSGQPITLFGNSPLAVASGALVHTPGSGANQAG